MSRTPSPHAPTRDLVTSLRRAGWGDLGGREWQGVRSTLDALVSLLPYRSGEGLVTATQVADAAGLSERWVRRCMTVLEDLGVITWSRGGVAGDRLIPSAVRIVKRALCELIAQARPLREAAVLARRAITRDRLAKARHLRLPDRYRRRSVHAELSADPPTPKGEGPTARPSTAEGNDVRPTIPATCEHDGDAGVMRDGTPRCPMCRAKRAQAKAAADAAVAAAQRIIDQAQRAAGNTLWTD